MAKTVRIACASAFWGDTPTATFQLIHQGGHLDYIVSDYLAEVTMCILARSKDKKANEIQGGAGAGGYVAEFVNFVFKPLMKEILNRKIKFVTNAGGLNPLGLKQAIEEACRKEGMEVPVVAAVYGDDLIEQCQSLKSNNQLVPFAAIPGEEESLWPDSQPVMSFNAYTGAFPIAKALSSGAQIVVTGRCVDSALALGPLIHEFKWKESDYDKLASGSLAGHIIECGCQATGGNYTDWEESAAHGWDNVGFPIAECSADGSFVITKPENTGGIVTRGTVGEQMLYEIGDPGAYVLPDVVCDWRNVVINQEGFNRVLVKNAKGKPPTKFYKVSITTFDGYRIGGGLMIGGVDAAKKAQAVGEAIFKKTSRMIKMRGLPDFTSTNLEVVGAEHIFGPHSQAQNSREVMLRLSAQHKSDKALLLFAREIAPAATGMAPAITGSADGRPRPSPVIRFYSCLVDKNLVPVYVRVGTKDSIEKAYLPPDTSSALPESTDHATKYSVGRHEVYRNPEARPGKTKVVPLIYLCYGRSGDKGDSANIGLMARKAEYYPIIKEAVTAQIVGSYMAHLVEGSVTRFELPGTWALNFILTKSLGGGGVSSLRMDRQGKTYAQILLTLKVEVPLSLDVKNPASKL